jgi:prolyl oligopeptidase
MKWRLVLAVALAPCVLAAQNAGRLTYPETKTVDQVDDFFGTRIPDPYRWLEDPNSPETRAWVEAQNRVTFGWLEQVPERERLHRRLKELWNYERYGVPSRHGEHYIFSHNSGLQRQPVIYRTTRLDAKPEVLLDPNPLSEDGTTAVAGATFTDDGRYMAYALSERGSDWMEWRVREVATGRDLPDLVRWSKFSSAAWLKDGSGFFYSRYDAPAPGEAYQGINKNQKLYFHRLGTSQDEDELVYERPDQPDWGFSASVTEDGRFLVISQWEGTERKNRVFLRDLENPKAGTEPFLDEFDAQYTVVGNDGPRFYVQTDNGAPRGRLVAIDRGRPAPADWRVLVPEAAGRDVLNTVSMVHDRFVTTWLSDAHEQVRIHALDGRLERRVPLPAIGTVGGFSGRRHHTEGFYAFTSFTYPTTIYRYDFRVHESEVFRRPTVDFRPEDYETIQVVYPSKDGTRVPMFLSYRKGLERNGQNPTYLYGYGGFNISVTPAFSPANIAWMEMGGIYASANLRGGGEYGQEWHDAGRLHHKQNVFDDFIAAAEYLIREKYTSTPKLAIGGGSNGGLLVGVAMTQRPDLFGAALPAVGVMDMLRFHKFTIGWAWTSDYGSAETKEGFETLIKYSPLHNIRSGVRYPATLVTTADHDDRVVPAHSHKFIAALQAAQAGEAPVLTRIETSAGHGAGTALDKVIETRADMWAFLVRALGMRLPPPAS